MFLICSYLPEPYPNAARLLAAIPSSALLWWRLLHKTAKNGPIPDSTCVAMNSGWDAYVTGPKFRNVDDKKALHFPGFHVEAVNMLLESTSASGIASDTLSLDFGISPDFATHKAWLPRGKWGIEAIANLGRLPVKGAMLVVGAPKIRGATGGPSRVFAFV